MPWRLLGVAENIFAMVNTAGSTEFRMPEQNELNGVPMKETWKAAGLPALKRVMP